MKCVVKLPKDVTTAYKYDSGFDSHISSVYILKLFVNLTLRNSLSNATKPCELMVEYADGKSMKWDPEVAQLIDDIRNRIQKMEEYLRTLVTPASSELEDALKEKTDLLFVSLRETAHLLDTFGNYWP